MFTNTDFRIFHVHPDREHIVHEHTVREHIAHGRSCFLVHCSLYSSVGCHRRPLYRDWDRDWERLCRVASSPVSAGGEPHLWSPAAALPRSLA